MKSVIKKSLAIGSAIALLGSSLCVNANEITTCEVTSERYIHVEGNLEENLSGILVNLWLYKDGNLIAVKQGKTTNGNYEFSIDLGRVLSGDYRVRTIAQIEDADSDTIEYFNFSGEIPAVYEDIYNHKNDSAYLIEKFNGEYKRYLVAFNAKYTALIESGKTSEIVTFLMDELSTQDSYIQDNLVNSLNYVAEIKTIQCTQTADEIVEYFLNPTPEQQQAHRTFLRIADNVVLTQFENNIENDIPDGATSEEKFTKYEERYKKVAEYLIDNSVTYTDSSDFIAKIEEAFVITDTNRCRGSEALLRMLQDYASTTGKFDLTAFNDEDNDKDAVLEEILVKIESGEIKTIAQVQDMLDDNIELPGEDVGGGTGGVTGDNNTSNGGFAGVGGGVSSNPGVAFPTTDFDDKEVVKPVVIEFKDMKNYTWAQDSVNALVKLGMLNGYSNDEFAPADYVTRAQFAKMMCSLFNITPLSSGTNFIDIAPDAWYADYVTALNKAGYINGVGDGRFNADGTISRQDAFTIVYRIMKDKNLIQEETAEASFSDWDSVSDYAKSPLASLSKMGLLQGNNGNIQPNEKMTRAEGAVVMYRVYEEVFE